MSVNVGARLPAHTTALGKVLLAALTPEELDAYFEHAQLERLAPRTIVTPAALRIEIDEVRANGWALCDGELEEGLRAVAVPLHDHDGRVMGALNVSTHAVRRTVEALRSDLLPVLQATAAQIEADVRAAPRSNHRARI